MSVSTPKKEDGPDNGLGALSIRDVVESALEQEDIMPVVSENAQITLMNQDQRGSTEHPSLRKLLCLLRASQDCRTLVKLGLCYTSSQDNI